MVSLGGVLVLNKEANDQARESLKIALNGRKLSPRPIEMNERHSSCHFFLLRVVEHNTYTQNRIHLTKLFERE